MKRLEMKYKMEFIPNLFDKNNIKYCVVSDEVSLR